MVLFFWNVGSRILGKPNPKHPALSTRFIISTQFIMQIAMPSVFPYFVYGGFSGGYRTDIDTKQLTKWYL